MIWGRFLWPEQFLEGRWREAFYQCDTTRCNKFKLKEGSFILDIRKKFFTVWVVRHWNRLPGEIVDVFKARLDGALSNLV